MSWMFRRWRICSVALITIATCWAFWPGLRSFFFLDDFFLLAIGRLLDNPLAAFVHGHFPGGVFFRPLSLSFWRFSVAAVGTAPRAQYALNLALHLGVSLSLWRLLCGWTKERIGPLLATFAFALHPIAIGTSLWLSDRFDLLAALFGVLALDAARRHRESPHAAALAATFVGIVLATLSKEIGLALIAPILVVWLWPGAEPSRPRFRDAVALVVLAVLLLAWRSAVLGSPLETRYFGGVPVVQLVAEGLLRWTTHFGLYLFAFERLPMIARVALGAGIVMLVAAFVLAWLRAPRQRPARTDIVLALSGLALLLATGVLQAPTARAMGLASSQHLSAETATDARVFYLSLLAFVVLVHALCRIAFAAAERDGGARRVAFIAAVLCVLPWAGDARDLARHYRRDTQIQEPLLRAALTATDALVLPATNCTVYFLGVDNEREFVFAMQIDAAIKALASDLARVQGCRFTTERTPWFYVMREGTLSPETAAPMQPLAQDGIPIPWPRYGGVEIAYLNLDAQVDATALHDARFLALDGQRFVDVTADVLAGRRPVHFRCARRREQCGAPVAGAAGN